MPLGKVILGCHSFQPPFYRPGFRPAFITWWLNGYLFSKYLANELPRSRAAEYQNEFLSYLTPMQSIEEFF
jgi:hypothetical protein